VSCTATGIPLNIPAGSQAAIVVSAAATLCSASGELDSRSDDGSMACSLRPRTDLLITQVVLK
jgi:hypothetical protein